MGGSGVGAVIVIGLPENFRQTNNDYFAPRSTPGMLPEPPNITIRKTMTDSQKLKDSGAIVVIFAANMFPAIPAQAAPVTKAASLYFAVSIPLPEAAVSSSLI